MLTAKSLDLLVNILENLLALARNSAEKLARAHLLNQPLLVEYFCLDRMTVDFLRLDML